MKWFDLKSVGGRLDRLEEAQGHFLLALSIDADRLERTDPETVERLGWIGRGREGEKMLFHNLRPVHRATDVAQALAAFYPEDTIRDVYTESSNLTQGEQVQGLRTRAGAKLSDFEQEMQGVASEDLQRIRATILRAQAAVQEKEAQGNKQPLGGRGFEFVSKMNDAGEAELGIAAVLMAGRGHVNPSMERLIEEIADEDAKDISKIERLRDLIPAHYVSAISAHCDRREKDMASISTAPVSRFQSLLRPLRDAVPIRMLEPLLEPKEKTEQIERKLGLQVRRDKSLPTAQYTHTIAAVHRAMSAISEALNRDMAHIVPAQQDVVLRISRKSVSSNASVAGAAMSLGSEEDEGGKVLALSISANSGSAFVHEFGHLIDNAYGVTPEERRELLESTGVRGRIVRAIDRRVDEGLMEPDFAEYAASDVEIWARTFEAAMVNRATRNGDLALEKLGGFVTAFPADDYAPVGDHDVTEKFLRLMNDLIEAKLQARFEKRAEPASTLEP
jgi:hypothetical protein